MTNENLKDNNRMHNTSLAARILHYFLRMSTILCFKYETQYKKRQVVRGFQKNLLSHNRLTLSQMSAEKPTLDTKPKILFILTFDTLSNPSY